MGTIHVKMLPMSMITEFPPVLDQNDQLFEIGFSQSSGELNITAEELEAARSLGDVAVRGGEGVVSVEFTVVFFFY